MTHPFVPENTASRHRLETLIRGLSDADLARTTPDGWSVATILGHLAFWDRRMLVLLRRWQQKGVDPSPVDADTVNDALEPLLAALPPRAAADLCIAAAAELDTALGGITPELLAEIEAAGVFFRSNRSLHRTSHIAQLEALLQDASG